MADCYDEDILHVPPKVRKLFPTMATGGGVEAFKAVASRSFGGTGVMPWRGVCVHSLSSFLFDVISPCVLPPSPPAGAGTVGWGLTGVCAMLHGLSCSETVS